MTMQSDIKIYQNFIVEDDIKEFDPAFIPNDWRHNPAPEFREISIFLDFFANQRYLEAEYVGVVSKKFASKTKITGSQFIEFIRNNPGYDVYFINPFPQNAYFSFNVWHQGERFHSGIAATTQYLFDAVNIPFQVSKMGRNDYKTLLYCNYWVGNATFWEKYIPFLRKLLQCIMQEMPLEKKQLFFNDTPHIASTAPLFPFIFERLFSTFLLMQSEIKFLAYAHSPEEILQCCLTEHETNVYREFNEEIDYWDKQGNEKQVQAVTSTTIHKFCPY